MYPLSGSVFAVLLYSKPSFADLKPPEPMRRTSTRRMGWNQREIEAERRFRISHRYRRMSENGTLDKNEALHARPFRRDYRED